MPTFTVKWENELYNSESPYEAAKNCLNDIQNSESLMFTVINESTGEEFSVDLSEEKENAVLLISNGLQ